MEIMDVEHSGHLAHASDHCRKFYTARRPFEQDVQGFLDHVPSRPDDEGADEDRKRRVDELPAGVADGDRSGDDSHRAHGVTQHMQVGRADVEVVTLVEPHAPHDGGVDDQAEPGHHEHGQFVDRARGTQPVIALKKDEAGEDHQREGVDEGAHPARRAVSSDLVGGLRFQIVADTPAAEPTRQ
jgi:hypothetical protein